MVARVAKSNDRKLNAEIRKFYVIAQMSKDLDYHEARVSELSISACAAVHAHASRLPFANDRHTCEVGCETPLKCKKVLVEENCRQVA